MFERYTEKARRAVFFARYEASQYGSAYIETEHLLLGLLREDRFLFNEVMASINFASEIRREIEERITQRERISTSVEMPLSNDCKKVLNLAAEASERAGRQEVGTEHLLLGLLLVKTSMASQLLIARGLEAGALEEQIKTVPAPKRQSKSTSGGLPTLKSFLAGLKWLDSEVLSSFFSKDAEFIDGSGKSWDRAGIVKDFEALFAPYAKKNASYIVEAVLTETGELLVANILWKNAVLASEQRIWLHRMSFVLLRKVDDWEILLAQVTPVQVP
jgi:Clp amino terminal domain, pathogenicity island component